MRSASFCTSDPLSPGASPNVAPSWTIPVPRRKRPISMWRRFAVRLGQEDSVLPVHDLEHVLESTHALGRAKEEKPVWLEGIVEHGNSFLLQLWPHVDQYIPAGNQVHVRKRRIIEQIVT